MSVLPAAHRAIASASLALLLQHLHEHHQRGTLVLSVNPPYPSRDNSGVDPTDGCDEAMEAAQKGEQLAAGQERHESQTGGTADRQKVS